MAQPLATTSINNWDYHNYHVQQELCGGQFVSAETTLLAAGPPRLGDLGAQSGVGSEVTASEDLAFPIGLLENVGLSQSKQLQRLFEIGSSRSYFIPGRVIGSVTLGRVLYHGPSLLKVLYSYYSQSSGAIQFMHKAKGTTMTNAMGITVPDPDAKLLNLGSLQTQLHKVKQRPGYDDFYMTLASDLFNQPCGLLLYFRDANDTTVGAVYLEECHVQGHQVSISSGSVMLMEGVSLQFDRCVPIKMHLPAA